MKRIAIAAVVLAACGALAASNAWADDKVSLKPKYVPGSYVQTITTDGSAKMKMGDRDMETKTTMVMTLSMTVAAPDGDGVKKITMKFKRVQMNISAAGQTFAVDTDKPAAEGEEGPAAKMGDVFSKLSKAEIIVAIAADESIKGVTGLDKLWDEMAKADPAMAAQAAGMKKSLGDVMIKNMMKRSTASYPDKPVGVGDVWTTELPMPMEMPGLGKTTVKMTNTLKAIEGDGKVAVTSVKGKLETEKAPAATAPEGDTAPIQPKITMDMDGTMRLNGENILLSSSEINIKGVVELGNGMTSDITTKVTSKSEAVPAGKAADVPVPSREK